MKTQEESLTMGRIVQIDSDGTEHYPFSDWDNNYSLAKNKEPFKNKKETNTEYIRKMSDRELAKWLSKLDDCPSTKYESNCDNQCALCWFDWLKSEKES